MNNPFIDLFSFDGRIRRRKYVVNFLALCLSMTLLRDFLVPRENHLSLYWLLYWVLLAQGAKRCHDLGHSGWWQLIPFYPLWLLFKEGQHGSNLYGEDPKERNGIDKHVLEFPYTKE